jgi:2',3'-cyclic-nucleotide 2'-phosphodiesterase (5'-nucleotidase family)
LFVSSAVLTIIHTNDFHNRLTHAQAQRLKQLKSESGTDTLLLDAGDAVSCGNATYHPRGEPILDLMNDAGYDAMTVGNREFHVSRAGFETTLNRARFPILCANVAPHAPFWGKEPPALPCVPHVVLNLPNWTVAVLGVTVPMVTPRMAVRKLSSFVFGSPIEAAQSQIAAIHSECSPDLIVALTHIGYTQDRKLAEAVPEIDLIVGGHSHTVLEQGERVDRTLIVQTGFYAHNLGRVTIERAAEGTLTMQAGLEPL